MKNRVLCSLFLSHCLLSCLQGKTSKEAYCGDSHRPSRVTVRHIEANGIGYNQGYTTLEGFFSPNAPYRTSWIPFLDLRGHVFNTGKFAANAGVGLRYLTPSRIWGANAYYDYRNTHHQHYNQVALGFETLGQRWDARINGYLPVGRKTSPKYALEFSHFASNFAYLKQKQQIALKGVNAEVGAHVNPCENMPLYFAAGPYYLGAKGKNAWGGQVRAVIDFYDYFRIEGNASYDNQFRWIGQGQASIIIPFGRRREIKVKNKASCDQALALSERAVQRVDRFEIIPVKSRKVRSQAIDRLSGQPFFFWFVDNTSNSLGTFESPFSTLLAAQNASMPNQIIYVFPGDGTTNGMNSGITLQKGQTLLGSFASYPLVTTKGLATIPSMTKTMPNIANTTGLGNVVTLASNNIVAGLSIVPTIDDSNGIFGSSVSNFIAFSNAFSTPTNTLATVNGINLLNPINQAVVSNCSFDNFTSNSDLIMGGGIFVELDVGNTLDALSVTGCSFTNMNGAFFAGNAVFAYLNGGTLNHLNISESSFSGGEHNQGIIYMSMNNGTLGDLNITNSTFNRTVNSTTIFVDLSNPGTVSNINILGCSFSEISSGVGLSIANSSGLVSNINIANSTFTTFPLSNGAVFLNVTSTGIIENFNVRNCQFTDFADAFVFNITTNNTATISNTNYVGNTFAGNSGGTFTIFHGLDSSNVTTVNIWQNNFSNLFGNSYGIITNALGPVNFSGLNNNFSDFSNASAHSFALNQLSNIIISECQFKDFNGFSQGINIGPTNTTAIQITNNNFTGFSSATEGLSLDIFGGTTTAAVTGNRFTANNTVGEGYAAFIGSGGTLCLEFTNNSASPATMPIPYVFTQTGGTFDLTTGSDASTNTGAFSITGTVGAPGSCTQ